MNRKKINSLLLICSLILLLTAMLWIAIIPPFQMPDEIAHYFKATTLLLPDKLGNQYGHVSTTATWQLVEAAQANRIAFNPSVQYDLKAFFKTPIYPTTEIAFYPSALPYTPIPYIGAGLGHTITSLTEMPLQQSFYIMRISSLAFVTFLLLLAYRNSARMFVLMMPVIAVPMFMNQTTAISSDGFTLGMLILFLCMLDGINNGKAQSIKSLPIASFALMSVKPVYFPLAILILFIKKASKNIINIRYLFMVAISFIAGLGLQIFYIKQRTPNPNHSIEAIVNAGQQLTFVLSHPVIYLSIIYNTIKEKYYFYLEGLAGNVGWLDTPAPKWIVFSISIILIFHIGYTYFTYCTSKKQLIKTLAAVMVVVIPSILLVFTSMYLYWTEPQSAIVQGVQGRYFLPLLLMIIAMPLLISQTTTEQKQFHKTTLITIACTMGIYCLTITYLFFKIIPRYYG